MGAFDRPSARARDKVRSFPYPFSDDSNAQFPRAEAIMILLEDEGEEFNRHIMRIADPEAQRAATIAS